MKDKGPINWISVLTNLGVIAGLALVAYEVRLATMQAGASAANNFANGYVERKKELALSAELSEIYVKANADGVESLTPVERFRITQWELATKTAIILQLIQYSRGILTRGAIRAMLPTLDELEKGIWAELDIPPITGFDDEIGPIREELRLRDR